MYKVRAQVQTPWLADAALWEVQEDNPSWVLGGDRSQCLAVMLSFLLRFVLCR